jgi:hypothetical protein
VSPTRRRKTTVGVVLGVAAVAAVSVAAFVVGPRLGDDDAPPDSTAAQSSATGGTAPVADATSAPPFTIQDEPTEVATDASVELTGGEVDVVLTYAGFDDSTGTVQANGFAAGVLEDGGTCTLTLTRGDDEVTVRSTGVADATTTSCGLLETGTGLAAGTWDAVLSYTSDDAEGTSPSMEVEVR